MLNKDKLLIVVYYNVDKFQEFEVPSALDAASHAFETTNDGSLMVVIVPVRNTETKIECINPRLVTEEEYENAKKACEKIKEIVNKKFLSNENEQ